MLKEDNNPVLSVGMIIKNEEKVLRRCLDSLTALFDLVPCELIIADTGSSDKSVEIAKDFTQNVYYYEWINDFAAARNFTLSKSKGKWFMFLDADEYLDSDISEIVSFFNSSKLYDKYNTMVIHFRNYKDKEKKIYRDSYLARFFKKNSGDEPLRFNGEIHEAINVRYPKGKFETIVHHTGYCYDTKQFWKKKLKRNYVPMRKEFQKSPTIRMALMLLEFGSEYPDDCLDYISFGVEYLKSNREDFYGKDFLVMSIRFYMNLFPEKALQLCDMYYKILNNTDGATQTVSVEMYRTEILYKLFRFYEVREAFCKYENLYQKCKTGIISASSDTGFSIRGTMESDYVGVKCLAIQALIKINDYNMSLKMLSEFHIEEYEDESYKTLVSCWMKLAIAQKDYLCLKNIIEPIYRTNNGDKINYLNSGISRIYYDIALDDERIGFSDDMIRCGLQGIYADILRITIQPSKKEIESIINSLNHWNKDYSELIYFAIKYNCDISELPFVIATDDYEETFLTLIDNHDDFADILLEYEIQEKYLMSINILGFITGIYKYVSLNCDTVSEEKKYILYKRYISLLGDYVMNLYNPEFLNENSIGTLPCEHQFGFYMYNAETYLMESDKLGYIREIKKALLSCEKMQKIVKFMLDRFKEKLN